jgi:hypothetical protein
LLLLDQNNYIFRKLTWDPDFYFFQELINNGRPSPGFYEIINDSAKILIRSLQIVNRGWHSILGHQAKVRFFMSVRGGIKRTQVLQKPVVLRCEIQNPQMFKTDPARSPFPQQSTLACRVTETTQWDIIFRFIFQSKLMCIVFDIY